MRAVTIDWPDDVEAEYQFSDVELARHIRLMAALKMFELGEISSGKAAEFAGLSRVEFFDACGRYKVPAANYAADALITDLQTAREAAR